MYVYDNDIDIHSVPVHDIKQNANKSHHIVVQHIALYATFRLIVTFQVALRHSAPSLAAVFWLLRDDIVRSRVPIKPQLFYVGPL